MANFTPINFKDEPNTTTPLSSSNLNLLQTRINSAFTTLTNQINNMGKTLFPVGSIFESDVDTNPGAFLGGTWEYYGTGKVLIGVDSNDEDFSESNLTGGEKEHTLTVAQLPSHRHVGIYNASGAQERKAGYGSTSTHTGTLNENTSNNFESLATGYTGSNEPFNVIDPYITVYRWKRVS